MYPIDKIKVADRQRQKFDKKQMEALKESIKTVGLLHPIVLTENQAGLHLVAGERRLRAVTELHEEEVRITFEGDVIVPGHIPASVNFMSSDEAFEAELHENIKRADLTWQEETQAIAELHARRKEKNPEQTQEDTAQEIREATGGDNPVTRQKVRRAELLAPFLEDEEIQKASNENAAFRIMQEKLTAEFNAALDKETIEEFTQPSSPHSFYVGDMQEVCMTLPCGHYDLVITDPPYGLGVENFGGAQEQKHRYDESDAEQLNHATVRWLSLLCKDSAHAYIFCDFDMFYKLKMWMEQAEWKVRRKPIIWSKGPRGHLPDGGVHGFRNGYECILFAQRGGKGCHGMLSDVLHVVDHSEKHHAAQKPEELYRMLMQQSADVGSKVLDLFAGSGVVFAAADNCDMIATGIELDERSAGMIEMKHDLRRKEWKDG